MHEWTLLGLVRGLAVVGVPHHQYLLMGWLVVIATQPLSERAPAAGLL